MNVKRTMKSDTDTFELGDVITFKLSDGEKVQAKAVQQTEEGMLFITVDCLNDEHCMFKNPDGMGSMEICYANSDLRHYLTGDVLSRFPQQIRERMVSMKIGNSDNYDLIRIPTEREIFGENPYGVDEPDLVKQLKSMKNRRNRIACQGCKTGTFEWYWLQNKVEDSAADFTYVGIYGYAIDSHASYPLGVRPVFLLS